MSRPFDAVIFDMDGVIFDSEVKVIECWKDVAKKYGIPQIEEACRECLGMNRQATKERMLKRYGADFPYDEYKQEMSDLFHERYSDGRLPLKPGVKELLAFLKERNIKIALASSTRYQVVSSLLRDAGILDYFQELVCGDMVERSKPAPDIFLKACECLQVEPERAYAIEDSYNGIRSAYQGKLHPIMVPDLAEPTEEMRTMAEQILPTLLEVQEYFRQKLDT